MYLFLGGYIRNDSFLLQIGAILGDTNIDVTKNKKCETENIYKFH
jgi:hypothetical protein